MIRSGDVAIRALGLTRSFADHVAVRGVDLEVRTGELFSLLGPNGAGKTTTIRMLCCLLRPSGGTASIMGHDVMTDPLAVKQIIGVSPQETAVAPNLDARENLMLIARLHGVERCEATHRIDELLHLTGLTDRAGGRARHLSGGMRRRLSLAMALVSHPQVLFLDEPTIGLDPQARRDMWSHIAELKGRTTVVLTTHYLEEAEALADRIAVMDAGALVASGSPQRLKERVAGAPVMVIDSSTVSDEALDALRERYPTARRTDIGVDIEAHDVSVNEIHDRLRPFDVVIHSAAIRHVTLDDVFARLTGDETRDVMRR